MTNSDLEQQTNKPLHLIAREYLMLLQGSCTDPSTNYCELWHVLTFLHNLITASEAEYLQED
ncbi:hypothetical protein [Vibrio gazogenes]|uniref:Uncharacterized protein n=1 Tax=Vibrio gazogenes DSM 21264 = NBRC 103151 TaxID=1123492 RepID=A0A1M4XX21_VIBGA|nr:hypothetical protein [Vibrio gazogenes]USP12847.1 hypothetical protein MKS89_10395 [Vibrio gazogenes]SHE98134.1 hypothetical protein SAMN02745781_01208 [Vibrio gazogenes DSM 21264] [Vibrio gazogenes DSM 21264 = NBRC 103151]SJN58840.1 hypothetical protein BQ6471_03212 [Vibrio gazogenes]